MVNSRVTRFIKSPYIFGPMAFGGVAGAAAGYYYGSDIKKILDTYGIPTKMPLPNGFPMSLVLPPSPPTSSPSPSPPPPPPRKALMQQEQQQKTTIAESVSQLFLDSAKDGKNDAKQIEICQNIETTDASSHSSHKQSDDRLADDHQIRKERQRWEVEADAQLKKIAQEHAEHLEKVIKIQKQLHDIENAHRIEEVVKIEQNKFGKQIDSALGKLNEIEEALNSRSAQDLENRRAKIFWTCCQNLLQSLVNGNENEKEQYSVVLNEVKFIKELTENDDFVQSICNCFPEQATKSGIATENGLKERFTKVHKLARRTAQIDQNGGGPVEYCTSWLHSIFVLPIGSSAYSAEDKIDVNKYDPYELLGRMKQSVAEDDFANAVRLANLLRGESASIFRDWIRDAQLHLHSRFLAEILATHAQVSSIRTTY